MAKLNRMNTQSFRSIYNTNALVKKLLFPVVHARRQYQHYKNRELYRLLDNIDHFLDEDPVLKIDEFNGVFYMSAKSHLFRRMILERKYEPELIDCCEKYIDTSRDVIDVGANIGMFSVYFAKKINDDCKVLAVEPVKNAFDRLQKNIKINDCKNKVVSFNGVASDRIENILINTIEGMEEYSSVMDIKHPAVANDQKISTQKVVSKTIDNLIFEHQLNPGLIKIDVEGAEHLVFGGMEECLTGPRPIILSELSDYLLKKNGSSASELVSKLEEYDYVITDPLSSDLKPGNKDFGDILCVPKENSGL